MDPLYFIAIVYHFRQFSSFLMSHHHEKMLSQTCQKGHRTEIDVADVQVTVKPTRGKRDPDCKQNCQSCQCSTHNHNKVKDGIYGNRPAERPASCVKNLDVAKTFVNCAYAGTMRITLGKTRSSNANSTKQWMS